jgi:ATP-dependent 26S proteasome regulatory subunit
LRQNLDDAFTRRIRFIVEFPFPEEEYRLQIWQRIFPQEIPLAQEVDLSLLARKFKLAGGNIRNIALAAAFLAAQQGQSVGMLHLLKATKREFQKMGRLVSEEEFWYQET